MSLSIRAFFFLVCGSAVMFSQPQVEAGKDLLRQKKIPEAIAALRQASQLYPRSVEAWVALGRAQLLGSMPDSAEASSRRALTLDDENPEAYLVLSRAQLAKKNAKEAHATARAGLKEKKDYVPLLVQLGFSMLELDSADAAIVVLTRAKELDANNPLAFEGLGDAYTKMGVTSFAVTQYEKSIEIDSTRPEALYKLGRTYYRERRYNDMVNTYRKVIALDPSNISPKIELTKLFNTTKPKRYSEIVRLWNGEVNRISDNQETLGMYMEALFMTRQYLLVIPVAEMVLKKQPNSVNAVRYLAHAYSQTKNLERGTEFYIKLQKIDTLHAEDWKGLGRNYLTLKKDSLGLSALEMALKTDSLNANLYGEVATEFMARRMFGRAAELFERRFLLDSTAISAYVNFGMCQMALENFDKASSAFQKAIAMNAEYAPSYFYLAQSLMQLKEYKSAQQTYEQYIELTKEEEAKFKKERSEAYKFIGLIYLIDKKYDDAEKNLKKSIDMNDKDVNALLWYAQTLHSAGKKEEACKWYQRVLKLDKDNKDAKKGMDMIPCQ